MKFTEQQKELVIASQKYLRENNFPMGIATFFCHKEDKKKLEKIFNIKPPKENKQGIIQIKHCNCGCDNIGKL